MLTPQNFYDYFIKSFKEVEPEALLRYDSRFTGVMLGNNGVLVKTLEKLKTSCQIESNSTCITQFYSIDMVYCSIENLDPLFDYGIYPANFYALIEHENNWNHLEQEIYRLMIFRAPLKIIITYDWDEDEKQRNKNRMAELSKKKDAFGALIAKFSRALSAETGTAYLFIVGNRNNCSAKEITWKAWTYDHLGNSIPIT
jgi:hypothetical protein